MLTVVAPQVLELRPKVNWNKGNAVNWIMEALGLGNRDDVFPIYIGDDMTDEDAFEVLENRCEFWPASSLVLLLLPLPFPLPPARDTHAG